MSPAGDEPLPGSDGAARERQIEDLYAAFHEEVLRKATTAAAGCTADAWDATQHAFVQAWQHLRRDDIGNWRGWLVKTAVRHVVFHRRRHARQLPLHDTDPVDSQVLLEDHVVVKETYQDILGAIGRLSERQRQAMVLVHIADCSTAEAAADMGVSPSTVRNLIHQARARLKSAIGEANHD
ncbi:sigma-70 family RNA polymerase sigma factor [Streptomyces sp. NPDC013455]|uniref:RNA polymerase sigma factor n=1 Tax=Streptomyces sp. NPDC013455 TaxID=3155605 RepID=UPI0033D2E61F